MHTLRDVEILAKELLNTTFVFQANGMRWSVNLREDASYTFKWDNAKNRFGSCDYVRCNITLSRVLCSLNVGKNNDQIKDTILHEIAHGLCAYAYGRRDGRGHGPKWKSIAKQIGCDNKRCFDSDKVEMPKPKYTLTCPTCGRTCERHRYSADKKMACGVCCDGKWKEEHVFIITKNH